jgi:hypothetical protein
MDHEIDADWNLHVMRGSIQMMAQQSMEALKRADFFRRFGGKSLGREMYVPLSYSYLGMAMCLASKLSSQVLDPRSKW